MGASKRKSRQLSEPVDEPFYSIRGILQENNTRYLVDWEDMDDQKFEPTWEPKDNVTEAAVQEWEDKKKEQALNEERQRKRKSTNLASSPREVIQIDDDDEQPENDKRPSKTTTPSGSKARIRLKHSTKRPDAAVEVTPPAKKLSVAPKRKPGRPRKSASKLPDMQLREDGDDEDGMVSKLPPRSRGRPRKSLPGSDIARKAKEQEDNGEDTDQQSARLGRSYKSSPLQKRTGRTSDQRHKRPGRTSDKIVNLSSDDDDDDDVPLRHLPMKRKRPLSSDDEVQHAEERAQPTSAKKRGRPRKMPRPNNTMPIPTTPTVVSRPEEVSMAEIEDSEMYDAAAAQLQRETRSAHKRSPTRQPLPRQEQSPEFDEQFSDFRSSQILIGTQPEPPRVEEQTNTSLEEFTDSQPVVDAAAASSLSAKNSPYEPGATSGSTFVNSTVNSSSSVHTHPNPLARRFVTDAVIPDSQSHLDASSVHLSEQRIVAEQPTDDQMETFEDATTESQVVVEQADTHQVASHEQPVPESSMAQVRSIHQPIHNDLSFTMLTCYLIHLIALRTRYGAL